MAGGKTAFVFGGGSALGAVQVGMLKVLLARRFHADIVVGSSVGAINAAYFAADPTSACVSRLEAIWRGLRRADVFPGPALGGLVRLFTRRGYLVEPTGLTRVIQRNLPFRRLEEAKLPCHIIATDLLAGTERRLASGPLMPALLASTAISGIFPAVRIDNRHVIDGGVANHTPISAEIDLGATRLIVLPKTETIPPRRLTIS